LANPLAVALHASGAETVSGTGDAVDLGETRSCVQLALVVTAASGTTPTLDVSIETGPTETGPWRMGGAVAAALAAAGKTVKTLADLDRWARVTWTIAGTVSPSFTFDLAGTAHTLYAGPSDLSKTAINATAIEEVAPEVLAECCLRASGDGETALNSSYELPIVSWGEDLRGHCASRAVFYVMNHRGRSPGQSGIDSLIDTMGGFALEQGVKSAAQMYFEAVASGRIKPVGIVDQTPDDFEGSGFVASGPPRRW
jgi:hypothetical protein